MSISVCKIVISQLTQVRFKKAEQDFKKHIKLDTRLKSYIVKPTATPKLGLARRSG
jgi:hypothetical protein